RPPGRLLAPAPGPSEVAVQDLARATAELAAVVRPAALPPVPKAARLRAEQVKERVLVARVVRRDAGALDLVVEQGARLLHVVEQRGVAAHPRDVVGPAAALHVEAGALGAQLCHHLGEALGA